MQPFEIIDAANASNQRTKAIEHDDGDDSRARQGQATDVACGREGIKSCKCEGEHKTDGQAIQHPDMSRNHLMHNFTDAVGFECLVQSEQAADVTNSYKEVERCSES